MVAPFSMTQELRALDGVVLLADAPLAPFTTIGTGGNADLVVTVSDASALVATLEIVETYLVPWVCLGAGSNLLVADGGYPGAVIKLGDGFNYIEGMPSASVSGPERASVLVGAGVSLARLAALVAGAGLSGLEFACGIPGTVGGGIPMNAGAYGCCLGDIVEEVEMATAAGLRRLSTKAMDWGYRSCRLPEEAVVTAVRFELAPSDPTTILERHRVILQKRRSVQPQGVRTFGSTFKNPSGGAAGRLLEAAGLKGVRRGGAEVSRVHANFLVNLGDATTADMLALMSLMREEVHRTSGVLLEPEVRLLGTGFPWESSGADPGESPDADG
jgi:UDP-N-acetylenolpyruvoylglucosamine reductase